MATAANLVSTASTSNVTAYPSGAFTPTVGDLLIVFAEVSATAAAGTMSASANGITFTQVTRAASGGGAHMLYCFVADQLVPSSPASMTVTMDVTGDAGTGCVIHVAAVAGMTNTGLSAIRQFARQQNISTGVPAPVFAAACLTANLTMGAVGEETGPTSNSAVPPTGTTELGDLGFTTPAHSLEYWARASGFTGTTPTWVSVASNIFASIAIELDTSSSNLNISVSPASASASAPAPALTMAVATSIAAAVASAAASVQTRSVPASVAHSQASGPTATPGIAVATRPAVAVASRFPKMIIPGYVYPDAPGTSGRNTWEQWIAGADAVSGIIANPGSPGGPGTFTDTNYQAVIAAAQAAGVRILGYVDEGYARPTASASLMDDFNSVPTQALTARANWDGSPAFGQTSYQTNGTPDSAVKASPGTRASNFLTYVWGDGEISLKLKTVSAGSSDNFYIYNRWDGATTAYYAYVETSGYVEIYKWVAGVSTRILVPTAISGGLAVGGTISLRTYSSTVELWYQPPAGTDTLLGRVTDSSIATSGKFGFEVQDIATFSFDSVSGGAILSTQKDQIDRWFSLYGIRDIFFDQVTSDGASQPYCKLITDYAHAAGASVVMLNQGTTVDESYASIAELLCTFEGTKTAYDSYVKDSWNDQYPGKMVHLIYNVANSTDMAAVVDQADNLGAGYVYAVDTSVWFAQSTFFQAEVDKLRWPHGTFAIPVPSATATASAAAPTFLAILAPATATASAPNPGFTAAVPTSSATATASAAASSPSFSVPVPSGSATANAPTSAQTRSVPATPATATASAANSTGSSAVVLTPATATASAATSSQTRSVTTTPATATGNAGIHVGRFSFTTTPANAVASAPNPAGLTASVTASPAHALAGAGTHTPTFTLAATPATATANAPASVPTFNTATAVATATASAAAPTFSLGADLNLSSPSATANASAAPPSMTFSLSIPAGSATASGAAPAPQFATPATPGSATANGPTASPRFNIAASPAHATASAPAPTVSLTLSIATTPATATGNAPTAGLTFAIGGTVASATAGAGVHSPRFAIPTTCATATASGAAPTGLLTLTLTVSPATATASASGPLMAFRVPATPATATASSPGASMMGSLAAPPAHARANSAGATPLFEIATDSATAITGGPTAFILLTEQLSFEPHMTGLDSTATQDGRLTFTPTLDGTGATPQMDKIETDPVLT